MLDTVRGYAAVAAGLAEAGARKAWETVGAMGLAGDDAPAFLPGKVQDMAEEVVASGRQNSELLVGLVRTEVDRAVGRMGFVREEELAAVRRHVQRLEAQLAAQQQSGGAEPAPAKRTRPATTRRKPKVAPVTVPAATGTSTTTPEPAADPAPGIDS